MALGHLESLWEHDSLKQELKNRKLCAFKNFKEPKPRLDFYPTYKKKPNRQLDFDQNPKELRNSSASSQQSSLSQLDKIYTTKYKEPFYKGGLIQDRIPSFCDRVLYHSLDANIGNTLYPEPDTGVLNCVEFSYKQDKCNNYGCIPHHLMGSDHSAIYCGLQLRSPLLFPCPPHELNDQGQPKSYQLKIEDIKILKKSPYHSDSTYVEFPMKTKICFPAPFEIENTKYRNFKPFAYTILQQDLEMYHRINERIKAESKRRLSQQRGVGDRRHRNVPKTKPKPKPTEPLNLMDMQHGPSGHKDAMIDGKDKGMKINNIKSDDLNKKEIRAHSIAGLHSKKKARPQTKPKPKSNDNTQSILDKQKSISDASESEYFPDIHPNDPMLESKNISSSAPISPAESGQREEQDHLFFNVNTKDKQKENNANGGHKKAKRSKHGGLQSDNPLVSYLDSSSDEQQEDDLGALQDLNKMKSAPSSNIKQQQQKRKGLDGQIHEDYFEDKVYDIDISHVNRMQRTRSKSVGSFAETIEKPQKSHSPQHSKETDEYKSNHNHHGTQSGDMSSIKHSHIASSSPIYKSLNEMSKKLTLITFGPSRRPTHGNIHCVFKVETNEFKGQCCIAFEWSDFAKEVEYTQFAELSHHGIPLYDKTGSPIQLKIHYKLSLIDKQIVFDYH